MAGDMKCETEMSMAQKERDYEYEIEDAVRALLKVEKIKKDSKFYTEVLSRMRQLVKGE